MMGGGGSELFFLAKGDFSGSMKDAGIVWVAKKKKTEGFFGLQKKNRDFFGVLKK